jgi:hypothetical protein
MGTAVLAVHSCGCQHLHIVFACHVDVQHHLTVCFVAVPPGSTHNV